MMRALIFLLLMGAPAAATEKVVAGLSQNTISITASFEGSEIIVYGAVKRNAPVPEGPPLQVIVTVEGPSVSVAVRKKERVMGIWVNTETVRISRAPSFYAIATTGPLNEILSETENLRHQISIPRAIRAVGAASDAADAPSFTEALIRIRVGDGLYQLEDKAITLSEDTLFRTDVALPANLIEGDYRVRIFLLRGGAVVDAHVSQIAVYKTGIERQLHALAHEQPLIYGLLSLLLAIGAGWGASAAFRFVRL